MHERPNIPIQSIPNAGIPANELVLDTSRAWLLLGWSMIHFLWVGGAVLIATGVLRLLLQRATPNVRYAVAVATLAVILVASPWAGGSSSCAAFACRRGRARCSVSRDSLVDVPYQPAPCHERREPADFPVANCRSRTDRARA